MLGYEVACEITVTANAYDGCNYGTVVTQEATLEVAEWRDLDCG